MNPDILKKTFDKLWKDYPKKVNPVYARQCWERKWKKKKLTKEKFERIQTALEEQKKTWDDKKFIPNASTWINQEQWETVIERTEVKSDCEFASKVVRPLDEFFNKPQYRLTEAQIKGWVELIQHVDLRDAVEAVRELKLSNLGMPTPKVFLDRVDACRARRSQLERYKDDQQAKRFFDPNEASDEVGRDHVRVIQNILMRSGRDKAEFCVKAYRELSRKYPDINYGDTIAKYERELNGINQ